VAARRPEIGGVAVVAWSAVDGRSAELARALGGESRCYYDLRIVKRWLVPVRYLVSGLRTSAFLASRRPAVVIVTNPPAVAGLVAWGCTRLLGGRLILDSHQDVFDPGSRHGRMTRLNRWLARRSAATLVANPALAERVRAWGGDAEVLHEAPPLWSVPAAASLSGRPRILFVSVFAGDEPVDVVLEAAARLPEVDVRITGDLRRCPAGLREQAPGNVSFIGFLTGADYPSELREADVVLVLTTNEDISVPRSAYEAVWAGRPLVLSDTPGFRKLFPLAVHVTNDADGVADGLRRAVAQHERLRREAAAARDTQAARWREQRGRLETLVATAR
jgi:glycosyltransferase involved in cell wall biosynthesis